MNTKHTTGQWIAKDVHDSTRVFEIKSDTGKNIATIWQYNNGTKAIDGYEQQANAQLIAHAPELLQMVYDLKQAVKKLSQDDLTQFDRDREAQIEGEAHELLTKINPDYYSNTNKNTVHH